MTLQLTMFRSMALYPLSPFDLHCRCSQVRFSDLTYSLRGADGVLIALGLFEGRGTKRASLLSFSSSLLPQCIVKAVLSIFAVRAGH
jgi:hypothetical protein